MSTTAAPLQSEDIKQNYSDHGYVVVKNAISSAKIDAFLDCYNAVKKHPLFVYFSQSTHVGTRPKLNEHGYIRESMQNANRLAFFPKFCKTFSEVIYDPSVARALTEISGDQDHVSWQNMFFDRSTGTIEHQDSWYLDTDPAGGLIGVWYALENIQADCGPFFVVSGSHKHGLIDRKDFPVHEEFVAEIQRVMNSYDPPKPMLLNKGDIILWHPFLIHGAFDCKDPTLSRKSFTSHFYAKSAVAKDTESGKKLSIYNHKAPRPTVTPHLYSAARFSDYFYSALVYATFLKDAARRTTARMSMRRDAYVQPKKGM